MEFIKHDFVVHVVKSLARASWSLTSQCARTELDWQHWNSLPGYDVQQRQVSGLGKHNWELLGSDGDEAGKPGME